MGHNSVISGHPNQQEFLRLTGFNGIPGFEVSRLGIRAQVNDYLGAWAGVSISVFGY